MDVKRHSASRSCRLEFQPGVRDQYADVLDEKVVSSLCAMAKFDVERRRLMTKRAQLRRQRAAEKRPISFLDPDEFIGHTQIRVQDARDGAFVGSEIPNDLQRQWIQGTGPAAKPHAPTEQSIRNVAYALLSGADGWMFDGEDALGQTESMSLENQRNLRLAIHQSALFMSVARRVADEMNRWSESFLDRPIVTDWESQLDFTTRIYRARGLHLDDRHIRNVDGSGFSASIVDMTLYVVNNYEPLREAGKTVTLYLPKIQTAEEAALWNDLLSFLEHLLDLPLGTIKAYVLVEQLEAAYQLMEIRAALGRHFVGFNTGRWDYINSVSDAMAWDQEFVNPNIDAITMTYGYMKHYEDRVRRAVNTPDLRGNCALWQGGMEPNIPVGSAEGVAAGLAKAVAGARREQAAGASGKWVAHWKMVHIVRSVWEEKGELNQLGRSFPRLTYNEDDARGLIELEPAPRTIDGARDLISVALQYGNAFGQGFQAAALKPADYFGNDDVLYLMEDMATGEIRLSILWEWLHKSAVINAPDERTQTQAGDLFSQDLFDRLLHEEFEKLLAARDRDVHNDSKATTLPIALEIARAYISEEVKPPWYIDLLNLNLDNHDIHAARERITQYLADHRKDGTRITKNLDFENESNSNKQELTMSTFDYQINETKEWLESPRFEHIRRLYSAQQVTQQRGSISNAYVVAKEAADAFYKHLTDLFAKGKSITTFGPYSPGQAVAMKRMGIDGIYLGGWATSAKGSIVEDPGPDLASYPLSQVPDEAAVIVRALLTADKNQTYALSRMTTKQRKSTVVYDYRPFIVADADTGHGGDAHVRNLIRRFVEAGVPGYHIEDQRPGSKKCGHQGGKVLVPVDEQIKRLNTARFQLDIMEVPGIIVARTDAESATLLESNGDERDQPFILGVTNVDIPSYKVAYISLIKQCHDMGMVELNGHMLYDVSSTVYQDARDWLGRAGLLEQIEATAQIYATETNPNVDELFDGLVVKFIDAWQAEAGLKTYARAVGDVMDFRRNEGEEFEWTSDQWLSFAQGVSLAEAKRKAKELRIHVIWDAERARTPEGYFQITGGIDYAIAKSLAVAPFADLLWMETKTADLEDARKFADAIHAVFPEQMLAYNLSPSFNWDTTGMSDEEMKEFPVELGKMGYVFNFITYGGHQIDGLAAEEFSQSLRQEGMLALARLQRKFRLLESPFKTPQTLVGGPRMDGALSASSGRTATTKAMGKGSTQFQHLVQTEVPPSLLTQWLDVWAEHYSYTDTLKVELRPIRAGSDLLELRVLDGHGHKLANVVFETIHDRRGRHLLSIRDQNTFEYSLRQRRLMTLMHLFLIHRYKSVAVHYVSPTDDNRLQTERMQRLGIYAGVKDEIGEIIVADVNPDQVAKLLLKDSSELRDLIRKPQKGKIVSPIV